MLKEIYNKVCVKTMNYISVCIYIGLIKNFGGKINKSYTNELRKKLHLNQIRVTAMTQ